MEYGWKRLYTAEVAGSIPASPTIEIKRLEGFWDNVPGGKTPNVALILASSMFSTPGKAPRRFVMCATQGAGRKPSYT
jgi:hypothetical protein